MILDRAERDFLERVATGRKLGVADREQDKVRQRCRRWGLVEVVQKPRRWVVTEIGIRVLNRPTPTNPNSRRQANEG